MVIQNSEILAYKLEQTSKFTMFHNVNNELPTFSKFVIYLGCQSLTPPILIIYIYWLSNTFPDIKTDLKPLLTTYSLIHIITSLILGIILLGFNKRRYIFIAFHDKLIFCIYKKSKLNSMYIKDAKIKEAKNALKIDQSKTNKSYQFAPLILYLIFLVFLALIISVIIFIEIQSFLTNPKRSIGYLIDKQIGIIITLCIIKFSVFIHSCVLIFQMLRYYWFFNKGGI